MWSIIMLYNTVVNAITSYTSRLTNISKYWGFCRNVDVQNEENRNTIDTEVIFSLQLPITTVPSSIIPSLSRLNEDDSDCSCDSPLHSRSNTAPEMTYRKSKRRDERKSLVVTHTRPPRYPSQSSRRNRSHHKRCVSLDIIPSRSGGSRSLVQSRSRCDRRQVLCRSSPAIWVSPPENSSIQYLRDTQSNVEGRQ